MPKRMTNSEEMLWLRYPRLASNPRGSQSSHLTLRAWETIKILKPWDPKPTNAEKFKPNRKEFVDKSNVPKEMDNTGNSNDH